MEENQTTNNEIEHVTSLSAEPVFSIGSFPVTNALLTSWVAVLVIVILSVIARLKQKNVPGKLQHFFEIIIDGALNLCDQVTGSRALSMKIFPVAISIFFFVLINNWLGILPLTSFGLLNGHELTPFLRSGTADLNTTLALGVFAVIASNLFGIFTVGAWKVFNKYINLKVLKTIVTDVKKDPTVLIVAPIKFFVGIIEIIGEIAKIASLSFRLFGNVFAGEVLITAMAAVFAYLIPVPFLFLEVLVGLIQALIFSMLTIVYFTIASQDHDEHEEHAHA